MNPMLTQPAGHSPTAPGTSSSVSGKKGTAEVQNFGLLLGSAMSRGTTGEKQTTGPASKAGGQPKASETAQNLDSTGMAAAPPVSSPADSAAMLGLIASQAVSLTTLAAGSRAAGSGGRNSGTDQSQMLVRQKANAMLSKVLGKPVATIVSSQAGQPGARIWNVRELAHQLNAALDTSLPQQETDEKASLSVNPASFKTQIDGDKIRALGTANLMKGKPTVALEPALAAPAAAVRASIQPSLESMIDSIRSQTADSSTLASKVEIAIAPKEDAAPQKGDFGGMLNVQPNKTAALEWSAQPVVENAEKPRMPGMIEQVRQVADFLAERTDGVIRMGQQGMEANLKLYPPDLGQVRVEMTVQNDRTMQAQFIVERPETALLLQQHLQSFQDGLGRHGLVVERVQITVRPASSSQEGSSKQTESQDQRRESLGAQGRGSQGQKRGAGEDWRDPDEF